jgi:hypothetical protein
MRIPKSDDEWGQMFHRGMMHAFVVAALCVAASRCVAQEIPATVAETLSGKQVAIRTATQGHRTVLVAGFSREAGTGCTDWVKTLRADRAFAGAAVYEIAMLEGAPGFIRGMIKSGMRKGLSAQEQDQFLVLTQDEKQWRIYFDAHADNEPYLVLLDATGKTLWRGHGAVAGSEPALKAAVR